MVYSGSDATAEWAAIASGDLVRRLVEFARLIRSHDIAATSGRVIDAQRSLCHIDIARREDFYIALQANLVSRPEDIPRFEMLFDQYWRGDDPLQPEGDEANSPPPDGVQNPPLGESTRPPQRRGNSGKALSDPDEEPEGVRYSAIEVLAARDFSSLDAEELQQMQEVMAQMAPKLLTVRSRRFRPGMTGSRLDFPRTLRQSLHTGGDVIDLAWRRPRVDTAHLVLLCDVSQSMERYSRFLIQFMYAFQNELPSTETFVFSTRLTRLTTALRSRHLDDALAEATAASAGWSSGTKIGECLERFTTRDGQHMLDRRTVVVILSDGWDQGDSQLLGEQMSIIKRRSRLVVWLNPLLGDSEYRPLVSGLRAALPHIDLFLPCHNLASLQAFAATLRKL